MNNIDAFKAACELLPDGVTWGEPIIPSIVQSIAQAAIASQAQQPIVTDEMIAAAEAVEDLYRRGTPDTWKKVFLAMWREMPSVQS